MHNNPEYLKQLPKRALKTIRTLAKGNGAERDSIQIKQASGEILTCEAITHLELHHEIQSETKKGQHEIGTPLKDPAEINKAIEEVSTGALKNDEVRRTMSDILLTRPDKGFSLHAQYFDLPQLNRDYSYVEPCNTCHGEGQMICQRCGGRRRDTCTQCHGKTMVSCKFCHGSGMMQGADGKQTQCNRCHGQRQVACPLCQKTGTIQCRQCKGTAKHECTQCGGSAFTTHIAHLIFKMKTLFEIDRAGLPHPVVQIFEEAGHKMASGKHIKIKAEQVKRSDGGLAIQYDAQFPYGDMEFTINGKPLRTHLFGYRGKMLKLPHFLEDLTQRAYERLREAAHGQGNVAGLINKASNKRLIAQALTLSATMAPKQAVMALKKQYPMGIRNQMLKELVKCSYKAIQNLTRKNRWGGLIITGILVGGINMIYFLPAIRGQFLNLLPQENIVIALDFLLIPLGIFLTQFIVSKISVGPIKKALGPLLSDQQRAKFSPKNIAPLWQSIALSTAIFMISLILAKYLGLSAPAWLPF